MSENQEPLGPAVSTLPFRSDVKAITQKCPAFGTDMILICKVHTQESDSLGPAVVAHAFHPGTGEADAGGSL